MTIEEMIGSTLCFVGVLLVYASFRSVRTAERVKPKGSQRSSAADITFLDSSLYPDSHSCDRAHGSHTGSAFTECTHRCLPSADLGSCSVSSGADFDCGTTDCGLIDCGD